jgi:membrane protein DedA with SNARE-associated domain
MDPVIQTAMMLTGIIEASKYALLWLGCYFEGTLVMLAGGTLLRLHQVTFWPLYLILVSSDFLADITWYGLGYYGARRFITRWGSLVGVTMPVVEKSERLFHRYHTSILVISKLTMGFGLAAGVLFTAGFMRVSFKRYCIINLLGSFVWVLFLIIVGYYFGNVIALIPGTWQIVGITVMLVIGFFFTRYVSTYLSATNV